MAEQESTVSALSLAQEAVGRAEAAYEWALELESLLAGLDEPADAPKWAFSLHRMASRAAQAADIAHTAALCVRESLDGGVQ